MNSISDLISPLSLDVFFEKHWGRQAIHIRGVADKFATLYSLDRFEALFDKPWPDVPVRACFDEKRGGAGVLLNVRSDEIAKAYKAGATVCVTSLERVDPHLAAFCERVKCELGYFGRVGVNSYWSPHGSGFDEHFDRRVATTLQIAGKKRWRYTRKPVLAWPAGNANWSNGEIDYATGSPGEWEYIQDKDALDEWEEVVLEPGDLLCLPAGSIHCAEGLGHSFALNLHFNSVETGKLLGSLVDSKMADKAEWRHVPPILAGGGVHGGVNAHGEEFLVERLDEAIALMTQWRNNPQQLMLHAAAHIARDVSELRAERIGATMDSSTTSETMTPSPLLVVASPASSNELVAFVGEQKIEASGEVAAVIRTALELEEFDCNLVVPGVDPQEVRETIDALVEAGVFVPNAPVDILPSAYRA